MEGILFFFLIIIYFNIIIQFCIVNFESPCIYLFLYIQHTQRYLCTQYYNVLEYAWARAIPGYVYLYIIYRYGCQVYRSWRGVRSPGHNNSISTSKVITIRFISI